MKEFLSVNKILKDMDENNIKYMFNGNCNDYITGFSSISEYHKNTVTWIKSYPKYLEFSKKISFSTEDFSLIIVDNETQKSVRFANAIVCDNPK